jgi:GNAT superfamily N-acetyltransferase
MTAVVALRLQEAVVVLAPPPAAAALERLDAAGLLDLATVLAALTGLRPRPVGSAVLSYAEPGSLPAVSGGARRATDAEVAALFAACTPAERDESGLAEMPVRYVSTSPTGAPAAVAGYETWEGTVAQVGVLAHPDERGRGRARVAAAAAAESALRAGLVPQWRSALENAASAGLGRRLGFVPLGRQLAVELPAAHALSPGAVEGH